MLLLVMVVQGQMLAGLLRWPQATFASKVELDKAARTIQVGGWGWVRVGGKAACPGSSTQLRTR
jgi:hypothetical protein